MKVNLLSREGNNVNITIDVTGEEFDKALNDAYQNTKHRFLVDGFRKGKAPRKVIESKFGSEIFFEDAISNLFNEIYPQALAEIKIEPVDHPQIDFGEETLTAGKGFTYNVTFVAEPEIEVKDYKGVKVIVPEPDVTDDDIEKHMESLRARNARLITVDKMAENGDTVVIDYKGFKGETQFEGGTADGHKLKLGSKQFIPGFEEQLIGVKAGDEVEVDLTFPSDYPSESLAGAPVVFKVKVHEVKEEELPELDDDFAKEISEFDTLEELTVDTRKKLEANRRQQTENTIKNEAIDAIYRKNIVDIPEVMIEKQIEDMMREFDQQLGYSGMNLEQYLQMSQTPVDEFKAQIRDEAERKVKTRLLIEAVARQEDIEVSEDEIQEYLEKMAVSYSMTADELRAAMGSDIQYVEKEVRGRKAVDFIVENADIEEVPLIVSDAAAAKLKEEMSAEELEEVGLEKDENTASEE